MCQLDTKSQMAFPLLFHLPYANLARSHGWLSLCCSIRLVPTWHKVPGASPPYCSSCLVTTRHKVPDGSHSIGSATSCQLGTKFWTALLLLSQLPCDNSAQSSGQLSSCCSSCLVSTRHKVTGGSLSTVPAASCQLGTKFQVALSTAPAALCQLGTKSQMVSPSTIPITSWQLGTKFWKVPDDSLPAASAALCQLGTKSQMVSPSTIPIIS